MAGKEQEWPDASVFDKPVTLTLKEFDLLYGLISAEGGVCGREKLLNEVWGYDYLGETRTLDMHVRTLRKKLGAEAGRVETVRGVGYRFKF